MKLPDHIYTRTQLSGFLALDFCNTVNDRLTGHPVEFLRSYTDLVSWGFYTKTLSEALAGDLLALADSQPDTAQNVWAEAITLREAIYGLACGVIQGNGYDASLLETLNCHLTRAHAQRALVPNENQLMWRWQALPAFDRVLWSVAELAAQLFTTFTPERLRMCSGCGWLFYDDSHNGRRVWCDMRFCGNRAKAQRHYERRKALL